jgi:hypothetical protein
MDRAKRQDGKAWGNPVILPSGLYGIAEAPSEDVAIVALARDEHGVYFEALCYLGRASNEVRTVALMIAQAVDSERLDETESAIHRVYSQWHERRFRAGPFVRSADPYFREQEDAAAMCELRALLGA